MSEHSGESEPDDEVWEEDDDEYGDATEVMVEIRGLSLYTHHGVEESEREVGQRILIDLRIEVGACDATVTDDVGDTVDYADVCTTVALVAQQRSYRTLERLCSAVADRILDQYDAEAVWVKICKPEPPIPLPVEDVGVELWRQRGIADDDED